MNASAAVTLLAHQGGWDEALLVLGPILVVVGLLRMLKKRVDRQNESGTAADATTASASNGNGAGADQ